MNHWGRAAAPRPHSTLSRAATSDPLPEPLRRSETPPAKLLGPETCSALPTIRTREDHVLGDQLYSFVSVTIRSRIELGIITRETLRIDFPRVPAWSSFRSAASTFDMGNFAVPAKVWQ